MKIGTILSGAFQYSARIPYFYRVIKATDKTVWLEELETYVFTSDSCGQNGQKMPDLVSPGTPLKKSFRIKKTTDGREYIKKDSYCFLSVWNGKPEDYYTD